MSVEPKSYEHLNTVFNLIEYDKINKTNIVKIYNPIIENFNRFINNRKFLPYENGIIDSMLFIDIIDDEIIHKFEGSVFDRIKYYDYIFCQSNYIITIKYIEDSNNIPLLKTILYNIIFIETFKIVLNSNMNIFKVRNEQMLVDEELDNHFKQYIINNIKKSNTMIQITLNKIKKLFNNDTEYISFVRDLLNKINIGFEI